MQSAGFILVPKTESAVANKSYSVFAFFPAQSQIIRQFYTFYIAIIESMRFDQSFLFAYHEKWWQRKCSFVRVFFLNLPVSGTDKRLSSNEEKMNVGCQFGATALFFLIKLPWPGLLSFTQGIIFYCFFLNSIRKKVFFFPKQNTQTLQSIRKKIFVIFFRLSCFDISHELILPVLMTLAAS